MALVLWPVVIGFGAGVEARIATLHAVTLLGLAVGSAAFGASRSRNLLLLGSVAGSGVFWRMHAVPLPWEIGKYGALLCILILLVRGTSLRLDLVSGLYVLLLLPSAFITWEALAFGEARRALSFNLSGPILLAAVASLVARDRPSLQQVRFAIRGLFHGALLVLGTVIATWTLGGDMTYGSAESSFTASGGYGPNQVSVMLGLGFLLSAVAVVLGATRTTSERAAAIVLGLSFVGFALATLSRGGVYAAIIALVVTCALGLPRRRASLAGAVGLALLLALTAWFVVPLVEGATSGYLSERYADTGGTGREGLARDELQGFQDYPVLGRGPGMSAHARGVAAHSEVTRMLGEHGLLGLLALCCLLWLGLRGVLRSPGGPARILAATLFTWGLATTLHAGFRTGAIAIALALASSGARASIRRQRSVAR